MGEPAIPTDADRRATRELAARVVESVRNDEAMPCRDLYTTESRMSLANCDAVAVDDLEALIFGLAQEVCALRNELEIERRCLETWRATCRQEPF